MVTAKLGMLHYVLDHVYGAFMHRTKLTPPFFSRGWGGTKLELLERTIKQLFPAEVECQNWPPSLIQPAWKTVWETKTACLKEGVFRTPCDPQLLSALPPESLMARIAFLAPKFVQPQNMACVVHLAGGVHAAMVGALHPTPIATLPFLSPHSAVVAFCEGILKHATAWEALRDDLAVQQAAMTLEEVRERMRHVLSLTDVTRFPIPKNPNAVIFVAATDDGYIPKHSVLELQRAWPGSEVRWVTGGHVSSFLLHNGEFRRAIVDGLNRLQWKEAPL
ncbi:hypothetical protein RJ639_015277 [Escallonia herrerae]|uniref:Uncharacterized protein n=1 Tax=Escallonia herrerae TaxID=1293975 RepID=A0AA88VGX4_9ASTE|nr:hypothetical protein RJ639_015277 [Escallonia herrerae]